MPNVMTSTVNMVKFNADGVSNMFLGFVLEPAEALIEPLQPNHRKDAAEN